MEVMEVGMMESRVNRTEIGASGCPQGATHGCSTSVVSELLPCAPEIGELGHIAPSVLRTMGQAALLLLT